MGNTNILNSKKKNINKINSNKGDFENIKSKYIFKTIINYLSTKKILEIVKINKNAQTKLELSLNDYKEYFELNSSIEIEIKPIFIENYKFINIQNKEDEKYFHIYFNNSKKEQKDYHIKKGIKKIKIIIEHQITSFKSLFSWCNCIESIYIKNFLDEI